MNCSVCFHFLKYRDKKLYVVNSTSKLICKNEKLFEVNVLTLVGIDY